MSKLNWLSFIFLPVCVGMGYLFVAMGGSYTGINHPVLILGGFMLWTALVGLTSVELFANLDRALPWWKALLSLGSVVALAGSILGGMAFMFAALPLGQPEQTQAEIAATAHRQMIIRSIFLGIWVYYLISLLILRIHYTVKIGTVVFLDGSVLYPGTKFTLYPWFRYDAAILREHVSIAVTKIEIDCSDGRYAVNVRTIVQIDILEAQRRGIAQTSPRTFLTEATRWIAETVCDQGQKMTLGQLLSNGCRPSSATVGGLPVHWDGRAAITLAS